MLIMKHRAIDLPTNEVMRIVDDALTWETVRRGYAVDILDDCVVLGFEDMFVFDPMNDPDYEVVAYNE